MAIPLTSTQLCQLLSISTKTLYSWERAGRIPQPGRDRRGWRVYSPAQVEAIRQYAGPSPKAPSPAGRPRPNHLGGLSARNQIRGTVVSISSDGLLSEVLLRLGDGQEIVAVVTRSSMKRLGLKRGQEATAVIKATEVMLFT